MDKIDLDAIAIKFIRARPHHTKLTITRASMKEAIHQALVLAKQNQDEYITKLNNESFEGWSEEEIAGYKTALGSIKAKPSILDVEKLII